MSLPFTPGILSHLVYGIESTVAETRVENGVNVLTSQQDACRTYQSSSAATPGTVAYTTVYDHVTTTYSGRPPYLVSSATNPTQFPPPTNQSNWTTPYSTHQQMPMSNPFMQHNVVNQIGNNSFRPNFSTLPYSQMPFQPNQAFMQPNQNSITQNPNQFSQPPPFQSRFPTPINYNFFILNQNPGELQYCDPPTDDPGRAPCPSIEEPGGSQSMSTSTTDLSGKQDDPCATSPQSTWPQEGNQTGESSDNNKTDDPTRASGSTEKEGEQTSPSETRDIIVSILEDMLPPAPAETTRSIITSTLEDMLPHTKDEVSENNGTKPDDDKSLQRDKETEASGFETREPSTSNNSDSDRRNEKPPCGCQKPINKRVTFTSCPVGDVTNMFRGDFVKFEGELDKWYLELEESERLFINQAEGVIDRDLQLFKSGDELGELHAAVREEIRKADYIDIELENVDAHRQDMEGFVSQLEEYHNQFGVPESWLPSQRKYIYEMFLTINTGLFEMRTNLAEMSDIVEEEMEAIGPPQDPVRQIVKILNIQLQSLNGIDGKTNSLCSTLDEITAMVNHFKRTHVI